MKTYRLHLHQKIKWIRTHSLGVRASGRAQHAMIRMHIAEFFPLQNRVAFLVLPTGFTQIANHSSAMLAPGLYENIAWEGATQRPNHSQKHADRSVGSHVPVLRFCLCPI